MAFSHMGGIPRALRYDNLKSVVLTRQPLTYNPAFLEFARYCGFEIKLCNPGAGNEKGRVERAIRTLRTDFCNIVEHHRSLHALNSDLRQWVDKKNQTIHRAIGKLPSQLLPEEKLKSVPQQPWHNAVVHPPKRVSKMGLLTLDSNRYSVPENFVGQLLHIHASCRQLEIYDNKGQKVATHPRCFDRNKTFISPQHRSFTKISPQAKKQRIYDVVRNLDSAASVFLAQNSRIGEDPVETAYSIFTLLRSHARQSVLSAIRQANEAKMPRIKTVLSLLDIPQLEHCEEVLPQQAKLLQIDYRPRDLQEYDK